MAFSIHRSGRIHRGWRASGPHRHDHRRPTPTRRACRSDPCRPPLTRPPRRPLTSSSPHSPDRYGPRPGPHTGDRAAAVARPLDAVGVMLGHGMMFHRGDAFVGLVLQAASAGEPLPAEVTVDVTVTADGPTHMSFLTRTLQRYGREELYVICPVRGQGALPFVYDLCRWLLSDQASPLATGETIGRTAEEKIVIQRVPDPTGHGPSVIRARPPLIGVLFDQPHVVCLPVTPVGARDCWRRRARADGRRRRQRPGWVRPTWPGLARRECRPSSR